MISFKTRSTNSEINEYKIEQDSFGDGTLKCAVPDFDDDVGEITIKWLYDNDAELFCLYSLARHIQERFKGKLNLLLPYIPHARQDRYVSGRLFTLKYFAEIINSLNFNKIWVLDPHSKASFELIHNLEELPLPFAVSLGVKEFNGKAAIMFPDKGAAAKYQERYLLEKGDCPFIIGEKHRNSDGRIDSYELKNFQEGTKVVLIRDDICSYGGTFVAAAKELRKRGVERVILAVSHCENNILKGDVFKYIDRVFTTDSICTAEHPQLIITKTYKR